MRKRTLLSVCFTLMSLWLVAQTKKVKVKDAALKNSYETFTVLYYNPDVRQGPYKRVVQGTVAVEGSYLENRRGGLWNWYNKQGEAECIVNYNRHLVHYPVRNGLMVNWYNDELAARDNRPIIKLTSDDTQNDIIFRNLRYPRYALERSIQGRVVIGILVDEDGRVKDYRIETSVDGVLDEAAMRVVRMIPFDFLPAYKKGHAIADEFLLPVVFKLQ